MKRILLTSLLAGIALVAVAQNPPRPDDHFWRRRVVSRIDLREKVNKPLVTANTINYVEGESRMGNTRGMVQALVRGWQEGKFAAYKQDSLHSNLQFATFVEDLAKQNGGGGAATTETTTTETTPAAGEEDLFGDFGDDFGDFGDDFGGDFGGEVVDAGAGDVVETPTAQMDLTPLEAVVEIIEDRIFDKGTSRMRYDIQYIRLVWVDPQGTLPQKNMVAFKYAEVIDELDNTQWNNRFNDAETRSVREILDLRLFNSFIVGVSNNVQPQTLNESEQRRQQMIEFEHHLWSY